MQFLSAMVFALAVSMDGFGVGLSYGLQRIILPWYSLLAICLTSSAAITCSMFFGNSLSGWLPPVVAERIGAVILIAVGFWLLYQSWNGGKSLSNKRKEEKNRLLIKIRIPWLGIAVQILREPVEADFDRSGVISLNEAMVLGFALAMDALGAGFGAAVAGLYLWYIPLLVGVFKLLLVSSGLLMSKLWHKKNHLLDQISALPALILVVLGLIKI